ncbi:MAG: alpha-amylase family glycosyl hydrolase [Spirochaetota bacterium]
MLIPKLLSDDQVQIEGFSPDWVKTLIMAQFRIETATPEGTFAAATRVLDHYAEMGVNGLWINPIWGRGSKINGYGNFGCHTIESALTGADTLDGSYQVVKQFVDEAHRRNIRVIFDIIVWGTRTNSDLVAEHPEFYTRNTDGSLSMVYGGYRLNWKSEELRKWFLGHAVKFILATGADGYRVDLAPDTSGYYFKEVRDALYAQGRKIILVSETGNERRETFDFEQVGVLGRDEDPDWADKKHLKEQMERWGERYSFLIRSNITEVIKSGFGIGKGSLVKQHLGGHFRFYTYNLLCHDNPKPFVQGNRVRIGYQAIFAPFIPLWWIGEEWNNPRLWITMPGERSTGCMFFNTIDWGQRDAPSNRAFFEDVKRYIRIRRTYPELFEYYPESTRDANIAAVASTRSGAPNPLQAYARFNREKAVMVVPNYQCTSSEDVIRIDPPYELLGISDMEKCVLTDLLSGTRIEEKDRDTRGSFSAQIPAEHLGVFLLERK